MRKSILTFLLVTTIAFNLVACGNATPVVDEMPTEQVVSDENEQTASGEDNNTEAEEQATEIVLENNEIAVEAIQDESIEAKTMAKVIGEWVGYFRNNNKDVTARLSIKPDGSYTMKCVFGADGWVHSYYAGNIETQLIGDEAVLSFTVDETDDANFDSFYSIGDYFVDGVRDLGYESKNLYLTQANNGDSLCDMYFGESRPVFFEYDDPYANGAKLFEIKNPSTQYYYEGDEVPSIDYSLKQISIKSNEIIDTESWFSEVGDISVGYYWSDDKYTYCKSTVRDYEYTHLDVYDNSSDSGEGDLLYTFDMSDFQYMDVNKESFFSSYATQGIKYALIRDDVLYISTAHRTYADACPLTGYITAIDINTGDVIWKTEPLINNADSFDFIGDTIVAGYGFTNEPDYLKIIDIKTGALVRQVDVKNAVDYIKYKNGKLYVRCYSYDYVFEVEKQNLYE